MDKYSYRMVIFAISVSAVALSFGSLGIALKTGDVPGQLVALAISSFGILGGLLVPSPNKSIPP